MYQSTPCVDQSEIKSSTLYKITPTISKKQKTQAKKTEKKKQKKHLKKSRLEIKKLKKANQKLKKQKKQKARLYAKKRTAKEYQEYQCTVVKTKIKHIESNLKVKHKKESKVA